MKYLSFQLVVILLFLVLSCVKITEPLSHDESYQIAYIARIGPGLNKEIFLINTHSNEIKNLTNWEYYCSNLRFSLLLEIKYYLKAIGIYGYSIWMD